MTNPKIILIQYIDKRGGAVHKASTIDKYGNLYPNGSSLTLCGKDLDISFRKLKIWKGCSEEVSCGTCKNTK
jgi:hypothetical protein